MDLNDITGDPDDLQRVRNVHDVRTRKMGDMIVVDAHLEVVAASSVEATAAAGP